MEFHYYLVYETVNFHIIRACLKSIRRLPEYKKYLYPNKFLIKPLHR